MKKDTRYEIQNTKYTPFIGMEVHVELKTLSKMFCGCPAEHFNVKPNTHTCPVCLGLPGALPVPNKKAVDWTIMIGLALGCSVNHESKFDRKHYFYPDLPKGYQISQYDQPLCVNGKLTLSTSDPVNLDVTSGYGVKEPVKPKLKINEEKTIRINRVHLEEDTGKLIHATVRQSGSDGKGEKVSLVDFNRSGVPLVEIVTEPDLHSASDAKEYVKAIHQLVRYLGVSDCDMEKGSMRLEANISISQKSKVKSQKLPPYKVEVKNLNSFRFMERAIDYEIARQVNILKSGKTPIQETRGWSELKNQTISQRSKEEAQDYRYFPEPDIPPMIFTASEIAKIKQKLPELPETKLNRFIANYQLKRETASILVSNLETATYYEEAVKVGQKHGVSPDKIANVIVNKQVDVNKYLPAKLIQVLLQKVQTKVTDLSQLESWVNQALAQNPKAVGDYKQGKTSALAFLIGQIQRLSQGKADVSQVKRLLEDKLQ